MRACTRLRYARLGVFLGDHVVSALVFTSQARRASSAPFCRPQSGDARSFSRTQQAVAFGANAALQQGVAHGLVVGDALF